MALTFCNPELLVVKVQEEVARVAEYEDEEEEYMEGDELPIGELLPTLHEEDEEEEEEDTPAGRSRSSAASPDGRGEEEGGQDGDGILRYGGEEEEEEEEGGHYYREDEDDRGEVIQYGVDDEGAGGFLPHRALGGGGGGSGPSSAAWSVDKARLEQQLLAVQMQVAPSLPRVSCTSCTSNTPVRVATCFPHQHGPLAAADPDC